MRKHTQKITQVQKRKKKCTGMCNNAQQCTSIHKTMHKQMHKKLHREMHQKMYKANAQENAQKFTEVHINTKKYKEKQRNA